jgi:hypothetical protein
MAYTCVIFYTQNGGGFAQSLCVTDVNADGLDDIIVGAPLEYVNLTGQSSFKADILPDVGRVYVFLGSTEVGFHFGTVIYF